MEGEKHAIDLGASQPTEHSEITLDDIEPSSRQKIENFQADMRRTHEDFARVTEAHRAMAETEGSEAAEYSYRRSIEAIERTLESIQQGIRDFKADYEKTYGRPFESTEQQ